MRLFIHFIRHSRSCLEHSHPLLTVLETHGGGDVLGTMFW